MILRATAAAISLGLGFAFTVTVLPRAKPDINSTDPIPPVETVVVIQQSQPQPRLAVIEEMTPDEQAHKIEDIEDRLRTIQKTVNRIELKAKATEGK